MPVRLKRLTVTLLAACICVGAAGSRLYAQRGDAASDPPSTAPTDRRLQQRSAEVAQQEEAVARHRQVLRQLEDRQRDFQQLLRKTTGIVDVTPEAVRASIARLEQEKQRTSLDLAGMKARQRAIEQALAELSKRAEIRVQEDPIAAELQKVVAAREKELERLRQLIDQKVVSAADMDAAGVALAEAKAKLLERREAAARREAGDLLDALNRELLMLSINNAEQIARQEFIELSLARFRDAVEVLDRMADHEREIKQADAELAEARVELSRRRQRLESMSPLPAIRQ